MKKLISGVVAVALSLTWVTIPPLMQSAPAQTRRVQAQELLQKLLQQAVKQTQAGQLQESLDTLQKALVLARRLKDTKTESEILKAIELTKVVLAAGGGSTPTAPPPRTTTAPTPQTSQLIEQGLQQTKLGEPTKAIATFNQALTLARQSKDKQTEATALLGIGLNYGNIGQLQKAIDAYNQALPIFKATNNRGGEATALSNIGEIYRATGQPEKALEVLNIALPIFKEVRSRAQEGSTLNSIGAVYDDIGQPQKAIEFYNQALLISREVNNPGQEATILSNLGKVYQQTGETQKALEYYNGALVASRQIGYASQEATTLNNIAGVYLATGQPQQALDSLHAALPIVQKIGDRPKLAGTLNNLGEVYRTIGQPQKALEFYNQALPIVKEVGDRTGVGITLNNIAGTYLVTEQTQKALEYYNQALPIVKAAGNRTQEATTINNIGEVYRIIGQPQKALEYYNQALPIVKAVGDRRLEGTVLNNIGGIYDNIGQLQKALDFYNQALPILQKLGDAQQSRTLNNIGVAYASLGQLEKALTYYNQALPILQKAGDRPVTATTLNNIGEVYRNLKQPQKALEFYNQALPIYREVSDVSGEAVALNNIGLVYYESKQQEQALTYYSQALPIVQKIGDTRTEASILSNIGTVYRDTNRPVEAIANLEKSLEITLKTRSGLEKANRQQFLASSGGRGIGLISLLIDQNQPERAYQWVNLTTTADLADYSRLIDAKVANPEAQKEIEQWNQANRQLESLRQQLQAKFTVELSSQVDKLQTQTNQQAETIARQFPEVAELFETKPTDIANLRANIPNGTVIIQPVLLTGASNVPDEVALFVVTNGKVTVVKQPLDVKTFDALVTQYRQELTDVRFPKKFRSTSTKLYDILIRPVEAQIANPTQLSIIATGKLRYIPFETLIDSKTGKYLIEKYPINNLTRLSSRSLQQPPNNKLTMLALGNPSPNDGRNLDGAEAEIKSIAPILPNSTAYLRKQASLTNFRNQAPRFSILHLATHGCFQPEGCAALKMPANTLLFSDRNLNIADAALLGLKNTDLVVLSACQTALQASSNGEEFAGIAYLFERAGARSAIASLWLARDEETKQLMVKFYQNLQQGKTKGEALRQAKLSLITQHPLYWSPFILIGDAR